MICYVLAMGKQQLGPHVVVGYGIKIFWPGLFITSPDHLDMFTDQTWAAIYQYDRASCACAKHQEFLFFRFACEAYTSTTE